jgi:hypothetical protein
MKTIIAAAIAFLALASFAIADEHHHHGHPVKVCSFDHHHHRSCHTVWH